MNALSDCIAELQLFLFFFAEGGVSFPYSVSGMAKNLRETTLQKPKLWQNKQKTISEKPQCIISDESNTICFRPNFYNFANKYDVFQEIFAV